MLTDGARRRRPLGRPDRRALDVARIDTGRLQLHRRGADAERARAAGSSTPSQAGTARDISSTRRGRAARDLRRPRQVHPGRHNLVENAVRHGEGPTSVPSCRHQRRRPHGVRLVVDDEGDGIPVGAAPAGVHEVLDRRQPRRHRARHVPRRRPHPRPRRPGHDRRRARRRRPGGGGLAERGRARMTGRSAHNLHESPRLRHPRSYGRADMTPAHAAVLVVEDERVINDAVADRLRAEGYVVVQAFDGPGAVERVRAERARPRRARRDAARVRRPRGVPPDPGRAPGAGADADRPRRRGRRAGGAGGRCRRLPHQAVPDARAGRPGRRPAAPRRAGRRAGRAARRPSTSAAWASTRAPAGHGRRRARCT